MKTCHCLAHFWLQGKQLWVKAGVLPLENMWVNQVCQWQHPVSHTKAETVAR